MSHSIANPRRLLSAIAVILALACGPAFAQNNFDLSLLNPGEIVVNLSATEQLEVEQDTLHAGLVYTTRGRDQVVVQDQVNRVMAGGYRSYWRTATWSLLSSVTTSTTYSPVDRRVAISIIHCGRVGRASSSAARTAPRCWNWWAELQELELTMSGLHYSLSPRRREKWLIPLYGDCPGNTAQSRRGDG